MNHRRLLINLVSNFVAFTVNVGINLFLTPYIVSTLGAKAYGFVGMANDFLQYAGVMAITLTSMTGRFVTIKLYEKDYEGANKYFNGTLMATIVLVTVITIPAVLCILFLKYLINVPVEMYTDVKLLFILLFINFVISMVNTPFSVATFALNRLELSSLRGIESNAIKSILIIILFYLFHPSIFYLGVSSVAGTLYVFFFNVYYSHRLLPQIHIKRRYFDFKALIELISASVWNGIVRLGQLFLEGFDLLIANVFIGTTAMGSLAIAKTIPLFIFSIVGMLAGVFMPEFTIRFAQNEQRELVKSVKKAMKIMGIIVSLPISMLLAFGDKFYSLWVPTIDSRYIQILSILSIATMIVSGSINSIYNIFTVTNKVKLNALWIVSTGIINIILVLVILKTTSMGLYAVAGVSTVMSLMRNLVFTAPYGAKCLNQKWNTFYGEIVRSILSVIITSCIAIPLRYFFTIDSWGRLALVVVVACLSGLTINFYLFLDKQERSSVVLSMKRRIARKEVLG